MNQTEPSPSEQGLWVCHLGTIPYREALQLQLLIRDLRLADELPDTLLLLEHPPVYTRGRRSRPEELALGESYYRARGIEIVDTDRGGRVTYHGPGQLVGYSIMRVTDVGVHLRRMEAAIVAALAGHGIAARSRCEEGPDYTGVWVAERKIASIGVHVSRGVSTHGFAINLTTDLQPFDWIVACGLPDVRMTSLAHELPDTAGAIDAGAFRVLTARCLGEAHGRTVCAVSPAELCLRAGHTGLLGATTAERLAPTAPRRRDRTSRPDGLGATGGCEDAAQKYPTHTPDRGPLRGALA